MLPYPAGHPSPPRAHPCLMRHSQPAVCRPALALPPALALTPALTLPPALALPHSTALAHGPCPKHLLLQPVCPNPPLHTHPAPQDMKLLKTINNGTTWATCAKPLPAHKKLAVASFSRAMNIFDLQTYELCGQVCACRPVQASAACACVRVHRRHGRTLVRQYIPL